MKPTAVLLALAASVLAAAPLSAQGSYPENTGAAVTDLAGVLTRKQEDSVRVLLAPARNRGADVRVVTIESVADHASAGESIEALATGLFNAWRIGDRPENDGTLLLVAVRDRKVRIEVGDGAHPSFDARAREVIDTRMIPEFRQEDYAAGILAASGEIARWYVDTPTPAPAASAAEVDPFSTEPAPAPTYQPTYQPTYTPPSGPMSSPATGFGTVALGVGGMLALMVGGARYSRHRKRKCPTCGTQMTRLDEGSDDVHLDSGQRLEEMLSSVDYDVWKCGGCNHHVLLPYTSWFSSHKECGGCGYRTSQVSRETVDRPTYHSTGLERVTQTCRHCGRHDEHMVTLPRLTPPPERPRASSSSSSDESSWGGGSSSGGSSSGRGASGGWSSGGSSGGGGSSSGRGASGSW
jgi:uncharacterized protein